MNLFQAILVSNVMPFLVFTLATQINLLKKKWKFEKKKPKKKPLASRRITKMEKSLKWLWFISIILAIVTFFSFLKVIE